MQRLLEYVQLCLLPHIGAVAALDIGLPPQQTRQKAKVASLPLPPKDTFWDFVALLLIGALSSLPGHHFAVEKGRAFCGWWGLIGSGSHEIASGLISAHASKFQSPKYSSLILLEINS
jgi:hypothetical protein